MIENNMNTNDTNFKLTLNENEKSFSNYFEWISSVSLSNAENPFIQLIIVWQLALTIK